MSNYTLKGTGTPGPWEVGIDRDTIIVKTEEKTKSVVAFATGIKIHEETTKANARLIAAAPELVESLQKLIVHCANYAAYLKTLGPEFAETHQRVQGEIDEAVTILRQINGEA